MNPETPSSVRGPALSQLCPNSFILPASGRMRPNSMRRKVVLPAPLGSQHPVHLALRDLEGDRVHGGQVAVAFGHVDGVDGEDFGHRRQP